MKLALTYDDIQLVPKYSEVVSRGGIRLKTLITKRYGLHIPIVAAPMDTVCEYEMAYRLMLLGGAGVIHRFMPIDKQCSQVRKLKRSVYREGYDSPYDQWEVSDEGWHAEAREIPIIAAVGATGDAIERAEALIKSGANIILIDVAHGHHKNVKETIESIKSLNSKVDVIAGNIATAEAANDLCDWGADGLRVGIGGGSLCTTRVKTGFGVPNVTCLQEIVAVSKVPVMADGGIKTSGDISKALAIGASTVMLGSLLAGTEESPGSIIDKNGSLYKRYRGAASLETKMAHGQQQRNVEGESTVISYKGGVKYIVSDLLDGVKSALSYAGANDLSEYKPEIVRITNSGIKEASPHLLK